MEAPIEGRVGPPLGTPLLTVRGEARHSVPADLAGLSVTVHAGGNSADSVRDQLARASARLRQVLDVHAAAVARSSTSGLHVAPVFGRSGTKITGYRGSTGASVEVTDFDALSDLVFALTALPDSQVDGPWWSLSPEHPAHREVRLAAIVDARRRAEDYAAAVGLAVADLVEISDLEGGGMGSPRFARAAAFGVSEAAGAPDFDFEPAEQSVSGQVTVRYTMAQPDSD